jgi:predicted nucleic acid-binding protein
VIVLDSSVVTKWFKPGERYEAEARDLRGRIERKEVEAVISELVFLEVVRGLKNAQVRDPALGITDAAIDAAYDALTALVRAGSLVESAVSDVKLRTKEIIMRLGLFMADAVQLATAVNWSAAGAKYFAVDDRHFMTADVRNYANGFGVAIVDLPTLLAALSAPSGGASPTP